MTGAGPDQAVQSGLGRTGHRAGRFVRRGATLALPRNTLVWVPVASESVPVVPVVAPDKGSTGCRIARLQAQGTATRSQKRRSVVLYVSSSVSFGFLLARHHWRGKSLAIAVAIVVPAAVVPVIAPAILVPAVLPSTILVPAILPRRLHRQEPLLAPRCGGVVWAGVVRSGL